MKLYLISQSYNDGYDTYDSAIVSARNHKEARTIVPGPDLKTWASPEHVTTEYVGMAKTGTPAGKVILASFNAR